MNWKETYPGITDAEIKELESQIEKTNTSNSRYEWFNADRKILELKSNFEKKYRLSIRHLTEKKL